MGLSSEVIERPKKYMNPAPLRDSKPGTMVSYHEIMFHIEYIYYDRSTIVKRKFVHKII